MSIEILPARLANQIAAGEVVERPASVVKELVENSIDAGATKIHIDIERGGHKLIRIRDNGQGIYKDELTLALSRHATSKLKSLDDLECISSLGFRGEALASISSVSRLTLSSKPQEQETAWQAFAEGRDMAVKIQPTAHPSGTTIEVKDLFFNTPARRKFLRTEKTEFSHIDELLKRIALSRFDISLTLTHNQKVVRQYRARESAHGVKRVAQVAGKEFEQCASFIESGSDGLKLNGWVMPVGSSNTTQYSYVNGRMMRDKLILHAIRQAFEEVVGELALPGFVIYVDIDPRQVDVNVHPAKHEVRFHQARLVHDFIVQAIKQVVLPADQAGSLEGEQVGLADEPYAMQTQHQEDEQHQAYRSSLQSVNETNGDYADLEGSHSPADVSMRQKGSEGSCRSGSERGASGKSDEAGYVAHSTQPQNNARKYNANQLYQGLSHQQASYFDNVVEVAEPTVSSVKPISWLSMPNGAVLIKQGSDICISHFEYALTIYWQKVIEQDAALLGKALLLPVRVNLEKADLAKLHNQSSWLTLLGFEISLFERYAMIKKMPLSLYSIDVATFMTELLIGCTAGSESLEQWLEWLNSHTPTRYFESEHFAKIQPAVEKNTECLARIQEKAVKIDPSIFLTLLQQRSESE
ncbi:DNA mismatch repair endonuclease MutL [Pseudoalteromonas sp. MMG012]|uniref:DNA mismatch repair endonuclease MutL n=1 Tax=Pseudoalteromonas sp. MMG012 TaxID=2822686 RepID=UPI001B39EDA3|nr:DNA mismatch repair endonuclease MutL [Pseudoalteromonas sp. MMG012]MBQ4848582.1 DNA mismatch repair endonuclease MutL [Pseudoalteromonas sp. MMG012]